MEIFSIPEEVFYGCILPKLEWDELLRLRRVSKYSKQLADDFIKNHPEAVPEVEINETDKTMDKFVGVGLDIPNTKIFLNNGLGVRYYEKQSAAISLFLKDFGPKITHLRVSHLSMFLLGSEWDFLDGLPNLKSLEANDFGLRGMEDKFQGVDGFRLLEESVIRNEHTGRRAEPYPPVFKSLKKLKIGFDPFAKVPYITRKALEMVEYGENLEHVVPPFSYAISRSKGEVAPPGDRWYEEMGLSMKRLENKVLEARRENDPDKTKLKIYDFDHYYSGKDFVEPTLFDKVLELCRTCIREGVKLLNVNAAWFQHFHVPGFPDPATPDIGSCVLSLVNVHPCLTYIDLPNLVELDIRASNHSAVLPDYRPNWPHLKKLKVTVDADIYNVGFMVWLQSFLDNPPNPPWTPNPPSVYLFAFLFSTVTRPQLAELSLDFQPDVQEGQPSPRTDHIVASCPNLKKLSIRNWGGTNKALCKFWNGLPGLEEISLEGCKKLGNVAFVGDDVQNPVFLKLQRLKKLSLKQLDQMPKITDTLFKLVLQHVKLTHLFLTSAHPLKNVTTCGIRALQNGKFADSIEKFPFQGWSLASCSEDEFIKLEYEYRSYYFM